MVYDPFSQVKETIPERVVEKIVYLPEKPGTVLGIDEKIIVGVIIGMILAAFISEG